MLLRYRHYIIHLILGLIIFFLIKGCNNNIQYVPFRATTEVTKVTTNYETITIPPITKQIPIYIKEPIYIKDSSYIMYNNPYEDSLISGNIRSITKGELVQQELTYSPKFPKYIKQIDSIFITNTIIDSIKPTIQLFLGLSLNNIPTQTTIAPSILLKDKKNTVYQYQYNIFNNTHNIGVHKLIKFKK
jgi:hypothetical protein